MSVRTTETTVTFKHPFTLPSFDGPQPAGTYRLVMDEEEILGLSFLAFRRTMQQFCHLAGHLDFRPSRSSLPRQFRRTRSRLGGGCESLARPFRTQRTSTMRYLGGISGRGVLKCNSEEIRSCVL